MAINYVPILVRQIALAGLPAPDLEHEFTLVPVKLTPKTGKPRRGLFDLAWPSAKLAVEIEGVVAAGRRGGKSRHTTLKGYRDDCTKYNAAQILGFVVLRFTQDQVTSEEAIHVIRYVFEKNYQEVSLEESDLAPAFGGSEPHPLDASAHDGAGSTAL